MQVSATSAAGRGAIVRRGQGQRSQTGKRDTPPPPYERIKRPPPRHGQLAQECPRRLLDNGRKGTATAIASTGAKAAPQNAAEELEQCPYDDDGVPRRVSALAPIIPLTAGGIKGRENGRALLTSQPYMRGQRGGCPRRGAARSVDMPPLCQTGMSSLGDRIGMPWPGILPTS